MSDTTFATCQWCEAPMNGAACTGDVVTVEGTGYYRWAFGPPMEGGRYDGRARGGNAQCHDCGTPVGGLHHPGCDMERCPRCLGQAISCGCRWEGDAADPDFDPAMLSDESPYARRAGGMQS